MGKYYTIQTVEAFNQLKGEGVMTGDKSFVHADFLSSYQWMINQMDKRIGNGGLYPIWVWTEKPNFKTIATESNEKKFVCLTLTIPDSKVLLSNFDAWHCVLNDWYCTLDEQDDKLVEQGTFPLSKEESWERIFDLDLIQQSPHWASNNPLIQGVLPALFYDQVQNVTPLISVL